MFLPIASCSQMRQQKAKKTKKELVICKKKKKFANTPHEGNSANQASPHLSKTGIIRILRASICILMVADNLLTKKLLIREKNLKKR